MVCRHIISCKKSTYATTYAVCFPTTSSPPTYADLRISGFYLRARFLWPPPFLPQHGGFIAWLKLRNIYCSELVLNMTCFFWCIWGKKTLHRLCPVMWFDSLVLCHRTVSWNPVFNISLGVPWDSDHIPTFIYAHLEDIFKVFGKGFHLRKKLGTRLGNMFTFGRHSIAVQIDKSSSCHTDLVYQS